MDSITVRCPAKINTFLAVGPPDRRGYHPLRTIFQAIGLYDHLTISLAKEDSFTCNVELPAENTVTRMRRLLKEVADVPPLAVHLEKHIPSEAGLGGGSSDAAGLVRGLLKLTKQATPGRELGFVAATIGADVPFFLVGGRAKGEGYGEVLTPLPDLEGAPWAVIVKPPIGGSTPLMYKALDEKAYPWRDWPEDLTEAYNDFERVADCESLDWIERLQGAGASRAGLSGSGSAVYGIFSDEKAAKEAQERVRNDRSQTWAVPLLKRSESL